MGNRFLLILQKWSLQVVAFVFLHYIFFASLAYSQQLPQTPQVQAEKKSEVAPQNKNKSNTKHQPTKSNEAFSSTKTPASNSTNYSNKGGDNGTEFWPMFFGYRIKITDSFMVIINFILALFSALLWRSTQAAGVFAEKQTALALMQTEIAEKQHSLQQSLYRMALRPRLTVRNISFVDGGEHFITTNRNVSLIQFKVVNIGGSRATIIKSNATFTDIDEPFPSIPPYSVDISTVKCLVREPGQAGPFETLVIENKNLTELINGWNNRNVTNGDNSTFYFIGYIDYTDEINNIRRMSFCRQFNTRTKRFVDVDDTEYEYND